MNIMQDTNILPFVHFNVLNKLKECLIAVWPNIQQVIIDAAIDQWRKRLHTCVRVSVDILNTFCEQTLANNLHFSCIFGSSSFYPSCQLFTVLMLDGR